MIAKGLDKVITEYTKIIACATVFEEMLPMIPDGIRHEVLEFGLHANPDKLREALQKAIDNSEPNVDTMILGYGLCSLAVAGLKSETKTLIVPKIDDCIGIFLGSVNEYNNQHQKEPGSLYMTKGWIEAGDNPGSQREEIVKKYGEEKARSYFKLLIKNYTRMVFINTGNYESEYYRERSKKSAEELNLRFEEIQGSNSLITKMIFGPWDEEFVIVPPGRTLTFLDFR